jgi:hypothetical protein
VAWDVVKHAIPVFYTMPYDPVKDIDGGREMDRPAAALITLCQDPSPQVIVIGDWTFIKPTRSIWHRVLQHAVEGATVVFLGTVFNAKQQALRSHSSRFDESDMERVFRSAGLPWQMGERIRASGARSKCGGKRVACMVHNGG